MDTGSRPLMADSPKSALAAALCDTSCEPQAWSSAQVSQQAAADALFGIIPISGRSPIGMDPFFALGDGIQIPLKVSAGGR